MPRKTFEQWIKEVDQEIKKLAHLSYQDLPDQPYRDWYENKVSPKTAAKRAVKALYD